ncbi:MAG: DUF916 domain-containing protein [Candidatus Omnitrophica bacterium]|nr:DUF916 domain-containing protein [Candidatus Omnitrophota bacterium]
MEKQKRIKTGSYLFLLILILFLFTVFSVKKVDSQNRIPLVVAPARQTVNIDPGSKETLMVKFFNESSTPISGNIKAVDFIVEDKEGSPILLEGEEENLSNRFSAASWVKLPFEKASIAPAEVLRVPFTIQIPDDARPGGRYVALFFETTGTIPPSQSEYSKEGVQATSSRIVSLIYIRVNGPIKEAAFIKKFFAPAFVEFGPIPIELEITNQGDYHIRPKGQVRLYDFFGNLIDETILEEKNIFPETTREYKDIKIGPNFLLGKYRLSLELAYGEQGKALTASTFIWAFPIRVFLVAVLTITILTLLFVLLIKKLKQRQKKLEQKLEEQIIELEKLKERYKDKTSS